MKKIINNPDDFEEHSIKGLETVSYTHLRAHET